MTRKRWVQKEIKWFIRRKEREYKASINPWPASVRKSGVAIQTIENKILKAFELLTLLIKQGDQDLSWKHNGFGERGTGITRNEIKKNIWRLYLRKNFRIG